MPCHVLGEVVEREQRCEAVNSNSEERVQTSWSYGRISQRNIGEAAVQRRKQ